VTTALHAVLSSVLPILGNGLAQQVDQLMGIRSLPFPLLVADDHLKMHGLPIGIPCLSDVIVECHRKDDDEKDAYRRRAPRGVAD
jgi:hypothetical protein